MQEWDPDFPPIYDILKSYLENAEQGPFFNGEIPKRPPPIKKQIELFGHKLNSPIGVPAGPLLNSRWIDLAAKLGFDVLTYKTIRSFAHSGHDLPHILYVKPTGPETAVALSQPIRNFSELTITNSFGMPSRSLEYLSEDIARANRLLSAGQIMIVSIVGTPNRGASFLDDFVHTALFAKEAGAKIIEANFSCPNVEKTKGILYSSPDVVFTYAKKISEAIRPIPLIVKMGIFPDKEAMRSSLLAAARGGAQGVCGINTVSMQVTDEKGHFPLGEHRKTSGICGAAIRPWALQFIRDAAEIISQEKLSLTLLGCGGIMRPEHFEEFLNEGAQVAMSATAMMWDPYLAIRYQEKIAHEPSHHRS